MTLGEFPGLSPYVNPCLDRGSSHLAVLGKRVDLVAGHHKMVEDADIDQGQRLHQRPCQQQVRFARLRRAGRVVVREHDAGGIARQRFFDHLARVDTGVPLRTLSAK